MRDLHWTVPTLLYTFGKRLVLIGSNVGVKDERRRDLLWVRKILRSPMTGEVDLGCKQGRKCEPASLGLGFGVLL